MKKHICMLGCVMLGALASCSSGSTSSSNDVHTFASPIIMPDWLWEMEKTYDGHVIVGDEEKMRFVVGIAVENVRHETGGPFAAAIFDIKTDRLIALGVNSVVPSKQSWTHAEMTAFCPRSKQTEYRLT